MAEPHKPTMRGGVQMVQPYKVRGWAFCPDHPQEHVTIEVRLDGAAVMQGVASMTFPDLANKGIGDGDHGFVLNMNVELPVAELDRLEVVARLADGTERRLPIRDPAQARPAGRPAAPAPLPDPAAEPNFPFTATDHAQRPVFVLGSARSGTTAMGQALLRITRFTGFGEGHLLELAAQLEATIAAHYTQNARNIAVRTLIARVPQEATQAAMRHGFVELVRTVFPGGSWIDKTPGPEMIRAAPLMRRIWPQARFIFMKRRPIENIESRRRKFPQISFAEHCQLWAESMMEWDRIRADMAPVSLEVDQMQLAAEPERVATEVESLLALTPAETTQLLQSFRTDQPQRTTADFASVYDFETLGWDSEQRATFQQVCGKAMRRFGYSLEVA